jgi:acyl-CoA thioester hydrolase
MSDESEFARSMSQAESPAAIPAADAGSVRREATPFSIGVRVYWEDTDAGGIVYYANYLKFMERARTEWLRALGVEQEVLKAEQGLMFVVVHADVSFRKPARYGDSLQVTCALEERSRASMTFGQQVLRGSTGELLVEGRVRAACLDANKLKPRGLPDVVLREIGGGER